MLIDPVEDFTVDRAGGTVTHKSGVVFRYHKRSEGFELLADDATLKFLPRELFPVAQQIATAALQAWQATT